MPIATENPMSVQSTLAKIKNLIREGHSHIGVSDLSRIIRAAGELSMPIPANLIQDIDRPGQFPVATVGSFIAKFDAHIADTFGNVQKAPATVEEAAAPDPDLYIPQAAEDAPKVDVPDVLDPDLVSPLTDLNPEPQRDPAEIVETRPGMPVNDKRKQKPRTPPSRFSQMDLGTLKKECVARNIQITSTTIKSEMVRLLQHHDKVTVEKNLAEGGAS